MQTLTTDNRPQEAPPRETQPKAEHLHIRASEQDKKTLAQAARIKKLSISQFLLQLALPVAEEIVKTEAPPELGALGEVQTIFALEEEEWQEFHRLLDAPPRALPELKKLLTSKPVWES